MTPSDPSALRSVPSDPSPTALKVVALPVLTLGLLAFVDIASEARFVLLILSACPTAITSYIMTVELDGDEALAAGSIVISTAASIPVLGLILAYA